MQAFFKTVRQLQDHINLLSKLDAKKLRNAYQVWKSYRQSRKTGVLVQPGLPLSVAFEPTTSCNLRCPECPSGLRSFTRPTGMLDQRLFEESIDQMKSHLIYLTFYFQGEPYLHTRFLDMVRYASDRKIYTATSTNAHYLDDKKAEATVRAGLDRLVISIDGTTQESYENYRVGGTLTKVLEGTRNMVKWKRELKSKTPHLIFQFLVVKPNEHQIDDAKRLAKEIGVNEIQFKTAQIYDYENGSDLIPENSKYARYRKNLLGKFELKNPLHNECWKMWQGCVVTWDGRVVPCCFDKDAKHQLGDLTQDSMKKIWTGHKYVNFRKSILQSRSNIDICQNCSEGLKISLTDG
ncbi:SPASM domain-containing protein [Reichenbachiella agarivorans]|uniref:SPASM domain-containing protein n=1 Tax=Reichenbachiella agarivorans TaxID=2979464 RepID=A0ABY6CU24_9BACT|nr:radical SAM/SPASM domain-containing protein [Reichenbachiella agarivorans]UXP34027.1 SPASM domain-containing protein [Reichenbachiella agarivorans]